MASVFQLADGKKTLRLTNFTTSNGPDVHVYLVAAADAKDRDTVTKAEVVDLGSLKGNIGDQNYDLPANADLAKYRAVLETSAGAITVEFFPDKAPEHVRNFLRLASVGVYDGTSFHRVVRGFVIQTGALTSRGLLTEKQQKFVQPLKPEFNDTKHVKGILSMARGDDPASAMTSFFIVTGDAPSLDGKYTVFGRVIDGLAVVEAIEQTAVNGEAPVARIDLTSVRILK